jgi:hypothetical protein
MKNSLTPGNYDTLVGHVSSEITIQLEKALMKMSFNRVRRFPIHKFEACMENYIKILEMYGNVHSTCSVRSANISILFYLICAENLSSHLGY